MYELLAIAGGVLFGVGFGLGAGRAARAALAGLGVAAAVSAFLLGGEAELSVGFLAWDLLQLLGAAVLTRALVRRLAQGRRPESHGERPA
jgi:hypothetical protein